MTDPSGPTAMVSLIATLALQELSWIVDVTWFGDHGLMDLSEEIVVRIKPIIQSGDIPHFSDGNDSTKRTGDGPVCIGVALEIINRLSGPVADQAFLFSWYANSRRGGLPPLGCGWRITGDKAILHPKGLDRSKLGFEGTASSMILWCSHFASAARSGPSHPSLARQQQQTASGIVILDDDLTGQHSDGLSAKP